MPKGVSGNPKGRPPKNRALTEILERAGAVQVDISGKKVSGKKLLASMLWEAATTGKVTLPDETTLACDFDQWLGVAKFIYMQTDGPPKQAVDLGGEVRLNHIIEVEIGRRDSDPPQDTAHDDHASTAGVLGE